MVNITVDVDIDLDNFDEEDIINYIENSGYTVYNHNCEELYDGRISFVKEEQHVLLKMLSDTEPKIGTPEWFITEKIKTFNGRYDEY